MDLDYVITLIEQMLKTALVVGSPILISAFAIGMIVSIFQAATQIQEMTLTFIPKIVAVILTLIVFGSWMFTVLSDYFKNTFEQINLILR
ncbi:MAG: flagellar biosynthesis protein FliQ [Epsilonproteobacteria bacterium]|nr:flagellar biosynthesis protein FliQ [Campylobacterota bacterium]